MAVFDFAPSTLAPFQFAPTLDGQIYTAIVTWNLFAQRWYLNLYTLGGALIVSTALIGSNVGVTLSAIAWDLGAVTATTSAPHRYPIGATLNLAISGVAPAGYNGSVSALVTGPRTFTYPLAAFPGLAAVLGAVAYDINLVGAYFASSVAFRQASQQFEVSP